MQNCNLNLPDVGSILFVGHEQNFQSTLVGQLAADALVKHGSVIFLTDHESEGKEAETGLYNVLHACGADASVMQGYGFVHNVRQYRTSDELQMRIERTRHTGRKPLVIVRDLGCALLELLPGASWLSEAEELARLLNCHVLTAGHYGPSPRPAPDVLRYHADEAYVTEAGLHLGLVLKQHKPTERTVKLAGHVLPYGVIEFETTEMETV